MTTSASSRFLVWPFRNKSGGNIVAIQSISVGRNTSSLLHPSTDNGCQKAESSPGFNPVSHERSVLSPITDTGTPRATSALCTMIQAKPGRHIETRILTLAPTAAAPGDASPARPARYSTRIVSHLEEHEAFRSPTRKIKPILVCKAETSSCYQQPCSNPKKWRTQP
jgi:hypothetical protein